MQMDMHRYYTGNDGKPRDRHLRAELNEQHDATKHVFKTRDGKTPSVNVKHDHKKGKLTYTDLPTAPGSGLESGFGGGNGGGGPCTCPLCVDSAPQTERKSGCQCPICLPALLNGLGGNARLLTNANANANAGGGEGDVDPRAPDSPRTLQDLMNLLSVHKPGKKIIQVAGDLDIVQTKVCMLPIEMGETGQSWIPLKPERGRGYTCSGADKALSLRPYRLTGPGLMVVCAGGLPDQKRILQDPLLNEDWAVGPRRPGRQQLVLKITKKVHVHVHFVLQIPVGTDDDF